MLNASLISANSGELLMIGSTQMRVLEDGSHTENRVGAVASILLPGVSGPPQHRHLMHDETFLITRGVLRFTLGDLQWNANVGDYIVVPVGVPHTFVNESNAPVEFFSTCTPAYYINYFREMVALSGKGRPSDEDNLAVMLRYATVPFPENGKTQSAQR